MADSFSGSTILSANWSFNDKQLVWMIFAKLCSTHFLEIVDVHDGFFRLGSKHEATLSISRLYHGCTVRPGRCLFERRQRCPVLNVMQRYRSRAWGRRRGRCRAEDALVQLHRASKIFENFRLFVEQAGGSERAAGVPRYMHRRKLAVDILDKQTPILTRAPITA